MIFSYLRGHLCEYIYNLKLKTNEWVYADNQTSISKEVRPCRKCGKMPTPEGYDACLGYIPGAISACCGHGISEGFIL